jgi:hypothetical protein
MIWFIRARLRGSLGAAGPGEGLVDIACNRPRLVQAKPGVFEGGDLSERVSHPVFGWRSSWRKDIDRDEFVRDALFFERETNCAHIDAVGRAEDDWVASSLHQMSLERWSGRPNASGLGDIRIERIRLGAADAVPFR